MACRPQKGPHPGPALHSRCLTKEGYSRAFVASRKNLTEWDTLPHQKILPSGVCYTGK